MVVGSYNAKCTVSGHAMEGQITGMVTVYLGQSGDTVNPESIQTIDLCGLRSGEAFGYTVAQAGEMDNDNFSELAVGAPLSDHVYLFFGQTNGFESQPSVSIAGPVSGSRFGISLAPLGNVGGSGNDDLAIGASWSSTAYVVYGNANRASIGESIDVTISGPQGSYLGSSVGNIGDIDGSGQADLFIGAFVDAGGAGAGYIFYGENALSTVMTTGDANLIIPAPTGVSQFGYSFTPPGEL